MQSSLAPMLTDAPWFPWLAVRRSREFHWGWLYLTACIAALSHSCSTGPTTTACVRSFRSILAGMPAASCSSPSRFSMGCFFLRSLCPWLLGLADREIGARRTPFRGQGWAIFALVGMLILGCVRWAEHAQALAMLGNTNVASEPVSRMAAEPYPMNPFRWHAILETPDFYQTAEINTWTGLHRQRLAARRALQAGRYSRRRSRQAHAAWPGLSGLGNVGRGPRHGPGPRAWNGPSATDHRSHMDNRRVHRSPFRLSVSWYPQRVNAPITALSAHRLGLHRRRPGRRRRSHGWPRTKIGHWGRKFVPMQNFLHLVERFGLTAPPVDRRIDAVP